MLLDPDLILGKLLFRDFIHLTRTCKWLAGIDATLAMKIMNRRDCIGSEDSMASMISDFLGTLFGVEHPKNLHGLFCGEHGNHTKECEAVLPIVSYCIHTRKFEELYGFFHMHQEIAIVGNQPWILSQVCQRLEPARQFVDMLYAMIDMPKTITMVDLYELAIQFHFKGSQEHFMHEIKVNMMSHHFQQRGGVGLRGVVLLWQITPQEIIDFMHAFDWTHFPVSTKYFIRWTPACELYAKFLQYFYFDEHLSTITLRSTLENHYTWMVDEGLQIHEDYLKMLKVKHF
jgi:hypothetical protein